MEKIPEHDLHDDRCRDTVDRRRLRRHRIYQFLDLLDRRWIRITDRKVAPTEGSVESQRVDGILPANLAVIAALTDLILFVKKLEKESQSV